MLLVNEQSVSICQDSSLTMGEIAIHHKPDADIFILNGFPATAETIVRDGDTCTLIRMGEIPSPEELEHLLTARHTPGIQKNQKQLYCSPRPWRTRLNRCRGYG